MGGINHQPRNQPGAGYLETSTRLSRSLSLARSYFELANVSLEDIVLVELEEGTGSFEDMGANLDGSLRQIREVENHLGILRQKMDQANFHDLPSMDAIDFDQLGSELIENGMVGGQSWQDVVFSMRDGGFRSTLDAIEQKLGQLDNLTVKLQTAIAVLHLAVSGGIVHKILEENLPGNLKVEFARLYCAWAEFQQFFLASSVCSTEQWYISMGYGSLVGRPCLKSKAVNRARELATA